MGGAKNSKIQIQKYKSQKFDLPKIQNTKNKKYYLHAHVDICVGSAYEVLTKRQLPTNLDANNCTHDQGTNRKRGSQDQCV